MEFALGLLAAILLKLEQLHIDTSFEFALGLLAAILLRLVCAWLVAREQFVAGDTCQKNRYTNQMPVACTRLGISVAWLVTREPLVAEERNPEAAIVQKVNPSAEACESYRLGNNISVMNYFTN